MMRRLSLLSAVCLTLFSCGFARGQVTRLWSQSTFQQLEQGTPDGVAITSDGQLVSGPSSTLTAKVSSTYVWSVAADKAGDAYAATGTPATVLKIAPDGKTTTMFTTKDLSVQVVRVGPDGSVYAATLPSGKVYKLPPDAKGLTEATADVVFDSSKVEGKPKYIWDLAFDAQGRLYIATGDPADIYRVDPKNPSAKPDLFFKSDEQHIRCLAFETNGDLIAGSDGSGLIYRIDKTGKGYVLYDSSKTEISSLAIGANGAIYAAAVGERGHNNLPPLVVPGTPPEPGKVVKPVSVKAFSANTLVPGGSEIDEILPDGAPRKLWSDANAIVYALRWTPQGLLAATGNQGRIYRIHEDGSFADIAHLEAAQATGFADSPRGTYISTANTGKVYLLSHGDATAGTYTSSVFDAKLFSQWGRAEVDADSAPATYDFYARVGNIENPERAWSDWVKVTPNVGPLGVNSARFVQWKAVLHPGAAIDSVGIDYLPVSVAPVVEKVMVQPGARVRSAPSETPTEHQVVIDFPAPSSPSVVVFAQQPGAGPLVGLRDRSAVTVRWLASDANGNQLKYAVYYRGKGEHNWMLLKKNIRQTYLSFDADLLPDGSYRVKVVASNAPSHNPGHALTGSKVSNRFVIDTTPPTVSGLTATLVNSQIQTSFTATDPMTPITHAEFSVDAGPWQYIAPVGNIADMLTEKFDFSVPVPARSKSAPTPVDASEHVITVRVYDRAGNTVTVKSVVQ